MVFASLAGRGRVRCTVFSRHLTSFILFKSFKIVENRHTMTQAQKKSWNPLLIVFGLAGVFFLFFLIVSGALYFGRGSSDSKKGRAGGFFGAGSVAVVELNGAIMDSKKVLEELDDVEKTPAVKAVVLRLNSPGGAVAPSQEIYEAVKAFKKPVVVSMGSVAASGAFYIAMGAKKVYANPGTITGSIGVIMQFANLSKLYDWAKIQRYSIKTGKFKDVGAEYRAMDPSERELLQEMVDEVLGQFKQAVVKGRNLTPAQVNAVADGRILSGSQAKTAKLVDELGTINDAIDEAGKLGGIKGEPRVVYPGKAKRKWLELLMEDAQGEESSSGSSGGLLSRLARELFGQSARDLVPGFLPPGIYWLWSSGR